MATFFSLLLLQLIGVYFSLEPGSAAPLLSPASAPASAPVAAASRLSSSETPTLAPLSSAGSGASAGGSTGAKKPEPPKPKPGDHGPLPLPPDPKLKPKPKSGSSGGSGSRKVSSPAQSPSVSETSDLRTYSMSSDDVDDVVEEEALPVAARAPARSYPWIPTKVSIRGTVSCRACNLTRTRQHHHTKKDKGIAGVMVELGCPSSTLDTITDHHGHFKMEFRHTMPDGFNQSCTVTVNNSTLPSTCNVPAVIKQVHVPLFHRSSGHGVSFHVPTFTFLPSSC